MSEAIAIILILAGSALTVFAGIGILRLPDVFIRMHAATKVGTLGSGLIMAGVAVHFDELDVVIRCVLVVVFLLLTAPIGAHMIGRAALRLGVEPWRPDTGKTEKADLVTEKAVEHVTEPISAGRAP